MTGLAIAPVFEEKDFDGSGGECWWVRVSDKRATVGDVKQWCGDNGVSHFLFGDRHFDFKLRGDNRFARWVGFVFEDDALLFYLAHA